jgi:hypothetical protein
VSKKSTLTLIAEPLATVAEPPATLGKAGAKLWRLIMSQYEIRDIGGQAILEQACVSRDCSTEFRAIIAREGAMVRGKVHPLTRHEREERALECRLLQRLGLDVEAVRPSVGRPSSGIGVTREHFYGHEKDAG